MTTILALALVFSLVFNGVFVWSWTADWLEDRAKAKPAPIPQISKIAAQLIASLASGEEGWTYYPETPGFIDAWTHKGFGLSFTLMRSTEKGFLINPRIYRWDGNRITHIQTLGSDEIAAFKSAIADRELSKLISKRIDMLDAQIESSEIPQPVPVQRQA